MNSAFKRVFCESDLALRKLKVVSNVGNGFNRLVKIVKYSIKYAL
jgi:hypothetical protein